MTLGGSALFPVMATMRGMTTSIPWSLGTRHQRAGSVSTQRHSHAHSRCHLLPGACICHGGVSLLSSCPSQLMLHLGRTAASLPSPHAREAWECTALGTGH